MEEIIPNQSGETKNLNVFLWILAIVLVAGFSFVIGRASSSSPSKIVESAPVITITPSPLPSPTLAMQSQTIPSPTVDLESICETSGPTPRKDYLVSYILKEGDNYQKIAEEQLGDKTRVSELTTLNADQKQLTVGSTVYLPPSFIKESSGNIFQGSGKIIKKDNAAWQISYGGGEKGPGLWIPAFMFKDIKDSGSYNIGDCVTVLLDNGEKVYSVKKNLN